MPRPRLLPRLSILLAIALVGCRGSEETGVALSGRVEYQGKPLSQGTIYFAPELHAKGRGAFAEIVDGRYSIPGEVGPFPGKLIVRVTSVATVGKPGPDGTLQYLDAIPDKFNKDSTLMVEIPNRKSYSYMLNLSDQDHSSGMDPAALSRP
jgi:hypothetical protein